MVHEKSYLQAFADFLLSERKRHMTDIKEIDIKLGILYAAGITEVKEAPWIEGADLVCIEEL